MLHPPHRRAFGRVACRKRQVGAYSQPYPVVELDTGLCGHLKLQAQRQGARLDQPHFHLAMQFYFAVTRIVYDLPDDLHQSMAFQGQGPKPCCKPAPQAMIRQARDLRSRRWHPPLLMLFLRGGWLPRPQTQFFSNVRAKRVQGQRLHTSRELQFEKRRCWRESVHHPPPPPPQSRHSSTQCPKSPFRFPPIKYVSICDSHIDLRGVRKREGKCQKFEGNDQ